jgi:hypothetical protein
MRVVVAVLFATAGCDSSIHLEMVAAADVANSTADMSCVRSVDVVASPRGNGEATQACAGLLAPGIATIGDLPLRAPVTLAIPPDGIEFMTVTGMSGTAGACDGWPVFTAATDYDGSDSIRLSARPALDCADRDPSTWTIRAVDFFALLDTKTCTAPAEAGNLGVSLGVIARVDLALYDTLYFSSGLPAALDPAGMATAPSMFRKPVESACIAAYAYTANYSAENIMCVYPDAASPCGGTREVVVPFAKTAMLEASVDPNLVLARGTATVGVILDAARNPIAGATITVVEAGAAQVVFTSRVGTQLTPIAGAATDASGTFIVYDARPAAIEIRGAGRTRRVMLSGFGPGYGSPVVIVL